MYDMRTVHFLYRHIKIFHKRAVTLPLDKPHIVRCITFQLKWVVRDKNDAKALLLHSYHTLTGNITRPENIVIISRIYRDIKWYILGTKLIQYRSEALSCWRIDVDYSFDYWQDQIKDIRPMECWFTIRQSHIIAKYRAKRYDYWRHHGWFGNAYLNLAGM